MKTITYTIKDALGIHARPAGLLVKEAQAHTSEFTITCGEKTANLKKLFSVMSLAAKCGDEITVTVDGPDADADASAILAFLEANL